jgi:hypothetical protein
MTLDGVVLEKIANRYLCSYGRQKYGLSALPDGPL